MTGKRRKAGSPAGSSKTKVSKSKARVLGSLAASESAEVLETLLGQMQGEVTTVIGLPGSGKMEVVAREIFMFQSDFCNKFLYSSKCSDVIFPHEYFFEYRYALYARFSRSSLL